MDRELNLNMNKSKDVLSLSNRLSHKKQCDIGNTRVMNKLSRAVAISEDLVVSGKLKSEYECVSITSMEELERYKKVIKEKGSYVLDMETTGLDIFNDIIVGMCIYVEGLPSAYVPINHTDIYNNRLEGQLLEEEVKECFRDVFEDDEVAHILHNAKYDYKVILWNWGIKIKRVWWDTLVGAFLLNENEPHGLKPLYNKYILNGEGDNFDFGDYFGDTPFNYIPISVASIYGANDGIKTWKLYQFQRKFITRTHKREDFCKIAFVFHKIEMPLIPILADIEIRGVEIREEFALNLGVNMRSELEEVENKLDEDIRGIWNDIEGNSELIRLVKGNNKLNYSSPTQLQILFYDVLGLKSGDRKNPRGTGEKQLLLLREKYKVPFIDLLLKYREINKLLTTYVEKLPKIVESKTGAVHTQFNQLGSACVVGDTLIPTSDGYKRIESFSNEDSGVFEESINKIVNKDKELENTSHMIMYENNPTIKLGLSNGYEIEGTYNHPIISNRVNQSDMYRNKSKKVLREFYDNREFKRLDNMKIGDFVEIPLGYNIFSNEYQKTGLSLYYPKTHNSRVYKIPEYLNEEFAEFLGMYYADGSVHRGNGSFGIRISNDDEDVQKRCSELMYSLFGVKAKVRKANTTLSTEISSIQLKGLEEYLQRGALNKELHSSLYVSPKSVICAFIKGLTLDSCYVRDRERLVISVISKNTMRFIHQVLANIGIVSYIMEVPAGRRDGVYYRLAIVGEQYKKFLDEIGVVQSCKRDIKEVYKKGQNFISGNSLWVRVMSIEFNKKDVYDFVVPKTHSFIGNGVINHNTGRFSSSDPISKLNLQNIPSHNKEIRKIFKAREGKYLIGGDFSQVEPRITASMSGDMKMCEAYKNNQDLYSIMASEVYNVPVEECKEFREDGSLNKEGKERRTSVKSLLLGILYGRGTKSVAEQIGKSEREAEKFIENFFYTFPKIKEFQQKVIYNAERSGYVSTLFGRKRRLEDMKLSRDSWEYQRAYRQTINAVIQGTAGDIMKLTMIRLGNDERAKELNLNILMTIHDELICEIPKENVVEGKKLLEDLMKSVGEEAVNLPMKTDIEVTEYWYGENIEV